VCGKREERGIRYLCGGPRCVVVHLVVGSHADETGHISCREVPGDRPFHTYRSERRLECKRVIRQPPPRGTDPRIATKSRPIARPEGVPGLSEHPL
jgi:hypothetical protein